MQEFNIFDTALWQVSITTPFVTAYDGDEDEPEVPESNNQDSEDDGSQIPEGLLTQEQVDKVVKKRLDRERKAWQEKNETLLTQLKDLEAKTQMPENERKALRAKIEELQNENMSFEERANKQIKTLQEELNRTKETLSTEAQRWQSEYYDYKIHQELFEAATANDARTPYQLIELLKSKTTVEEVLGTDGSPTGRREVKTTITQFKEDGTPFDVALSPMEAVAALRDMPDKWGNQFNSKAKDGTDEMSAHTGGGVRTSKGIKVNGSFEDFKKTLKGNESILGIKK